MAAKTITITKLQEKLNRNKAIDIVNMNEDTFRDCLEMLIRSETLGKDHAGTKGFIGGALLVKAFFKSSYPHLSNTDAMDSVFGFAIFIMKHSGSRCTFRVSDEEDFKLIGESGERFRYLYNSASGGREVI